MAAKRPAPAAAWQHLLLGSDPVRRAIYICGMLPAVWYFYLGLTDRLGADPQNTLERLLGLWALRFVILEGLGRATILDSPDEGELAAAFLTLGEG